MCTEQAARINPLSVTTVTRDSDFIYCSRSLERGFQWRAHGSSMKVSSGSKDDSEVSELI